MSADRELLEMAAKAAGYECRYTNELLGCEVYNDEMDQSVFWNPLDNDGDAFRLAVRLGMEVYVDTHPEGCSCTEAQSHTHTRPDNAMRSIVDHGGDPYAASRRAVVIAAAEIGKEMP